MSALDKQVGGDHYKGKGIQPVEYIHANDLDFFQGAVVKYITRWRDKDGIKDLEKCKHFLEMYIELESKKLTKGSQVAEATPSFLSVMNPAGGIVLLSQDEYTMYSNGVELTHIMASRKS